MHTLLVHATLRQRGVTSLVMDIGPSRRMKSRDCIDIQGSFDYVAKLFRYAARGFTFHVHMNGDSWKGFLLALIAVLIGRLRMRPAVLTMHAGPVQQYFPRGSGAWYWAFRVLFNASGEIICNHDPVRKEIIKYGLPPNVVHPIPAYSDQYAQEEEVDLPPPVADFLARHTLHLFSYALFRPEFTIEALWSAFAKVRETHPNAGLLVAGPADVPASVLEQLKALGLTEHVFLSGNLSHPEFLSALRHSDVYVRTHLRDGVCSSVLEALELGVPVVAAEDGLRPPSVVTYAPGDGVDLADKLLQTVADLEVARAKVQKPVMPDYLSQELELLLRAASTRA